MALINCPECSKSISDQSAFCINCGFPINKDSTFEAAPHAISRADHTNNEALLVDKKPQVIRPQRKDSFSSRNLISLAIVIIGFIVVFSPLFKNAGYNDTTAIPTSTESQVDIEEKQKNYEHYIGGTFTTMQSCLSFIEDEARKGSVKLEILSDKPERVSGSFNGNADMFFYCERKNTGTNGTFFEAAFPKFK